MIRVSRVSWNGVESGGELVSVETPEQRLHVLEQLSQQVRLSPGSTGRIGHSFEEHTLYTSTSPLVNYGPGSRIDDLTSAANSTSTTILILARRISEVGGYFRVDDAVERVDSPFT